MYVMLPDDFNTHFPEVSTNTAADDAAASVDVTKMLRPGQSFGNGFLERAQSAYGDRRKTLRTAESISGANWASVTFAEESFGVPKDTWVPLEDFCADSHPQVCPPGGRAGQGRPTLPPPVRESRIPRTAPNSGPIQWVLRTIAQK